MHTQSKVSAIKGVFGRRAAKIVPIAVLLMLAVGDGPRLQAQQEYTFPFTALINSGQEVPLNASNAFGVAFVTYTWPSNRICFSISYNDTSLTSPETAAHFHASAPPGQNAPVLIGLPAGSPKNGCVTQPLTDQQVGALFAGLWYVNVHTQVYPGGEIRGQVLPESVWY